MAPRLFIERFRRIVHTREPARMRINVLSTAAIAAAMGHCSVTLTHGAVADSLSSTTGDLP
ncbi:hypothetical protein [Zymobacter palmae]|uniref:ATPase related to the helicase subunit n=1 Tax=Zymobacter palmae TaxID=33074 RepID=A0A348HHC3_9GAMM|nr:hypothetical protein [Zymobacter palmae]BBG31025.1 ATPase related to the helicase subunit [Zymobacter palmae]